MKLTFKDSNLAIVDSVFEPDVFSNFWKYFNSLDFAYRSMTGWQKVWRINDGQILAGTPYYHSKAPFGNPLDWFQQVVAALSKQHLEDLIGKEGVDWKDILFTPYIYPSGTKISWHDDFSYTGAAIFYPHIEWNPHWGGELLVARTPAPADVKIKVQEDSMTRDYVAPLLDHFGMGTYVAPLPNRLVITSGSAWHSVNRVDQAAGDHMRCSVVAFFLKNN
jgi:hypothetical protein